MQKTSFKNICTNSYILTLLKNNMSWNYIPKLTEQHKKLNILHVKNVLIMQMQHIQVTQVTLRVNQVYVPLNQNEDD